MSTSDCENCRAYAYTLVRGQSGSEDLNMMAGDDSEVEGRLDEVYAYARQFSQSEVNTLYNDSTA